MRNLLALLAVLAAVPARAAFDGTDYALDPLTSVLTATARDGSCRLQIKEVRKFEVNGLYALSGNMFPYSIFYIQAEFDEKNKTVLNLYGLLGITQLRDSPQPCRALTVRIATDVVGLTPLKGSKDWDFSRQYQVDFLPGAGVSVDKLDAAIEAGTAELSRLLENEKKR